MTSLYVDRRGVELELDGDALVFANRAPGPELYPLHRFPGYF